ncbi:MULTISPECIES: GNAT family N-acetyltransferase [Limosilactobacillus]|uniref:N-acetyltransferase GCN5 n=1 Tax=Limosilactobacillus panis DSM 6035 TaxID=1423782 RepID=A0A0R1X4E4_9LACO|nr:GNAT family N-acetyltransferase [Limosilactobacillus panis]KRM25064.1 N-acetyltransferase GCN5 [Limosilactobacillus panis DSM 6035]
MKVITANKITAAHWQLFLRADPSRKLVTAYLKNGFVFELRQSPRLLATLVLLPVSAFQLEIKNLAVSPQFENRGLATSLLNFAKEYAHQHNYHELIIGTGSTSFKQLYLYQKVGFRPVAIRSDFFTDNYVKPIFENHLRLRDMIVLKTNID